MDFYEHIEDYINGNLSEDDLAAFKEEMAHNVELQKAVENHGVVEDALALLIEEDVRGVIAGINKAQGSKPDKIRALQKQGNSRQPLYVIAASFLVVLASYLTLDTYIKSQYSHQAVLDQYYVPPSNPYATRTVGFEGPPLEEAMFLFDLRRFDESQTIFEKLLLNNSNQKDLSIIHFYLGNIAFIKNDIIRAKEYLAQTEDIRRHEYLGQIYYLEGNVLSLEQLNESQPSKQTQELLGKTQHWQYKWTK